MVPKLANPQQLNTHKNSDPTAPLPRSRRLDSESPPSSPIALCITTPCHFSQPASRQKSTRHCTPCISTIMLIPHHCTITCISRIDKLRKSGFLSNHQTSSRCTRQPLAAPLDCNSHDRLISLKHTTFGEMTDNTHPPPSGREYAKPKPEASSDAIHHRSPAAVPALPSRPGRRTFIPPKW